MDTVNTADLLDCPNCLGKLTSPKVLNCHHFFCEKCTEKLTRRGYAVKGDGMLCPVCMKYTDSDHLRDVPIVNKLLRTCNKDIMCDHCETSLATLRCDDCECNYCDICKGYHDNVEIFRSHLWVPVYESAPQCIVDEVIFCKTHQTDAVRLHCKDCSELVCPVCARDVDEHRSHHTEAIQKALDRIVPKI